MTSTDTVSAAVSTSIRQDRTVRLPHSRDLADELAMVADDSTLWTDMDGGGQYREYWGTDDAGSFWAITLVRE